MKTTRLTKNHALDLTPDIANQLQRWHLEGSSPAELLTQAASTWPEVPLDLLFGHIQKIVAQTWLQSIQEKRLQELERLEPRLQEEQCPTAIHSLYRGLLRDLETYCQKVLAQKPTVEELVEASTRSSPESAMEKPAPEAVSTPAPPAPGNTASPMPVHRPVVTRVACLPLLLFLAGFLLKPARLSAAAYQSSIQTPGIPVEKSCMLRADVQRTCFMRKPRDANPFIPAAPVNTAGGGGTGISHLHRCYP
ncbi:MAG TPA: hypothetical protein PKD72_09825 [Gemmatales bacterium]|nr:hypothetical protein [Gemmatales bacterium]